MLSGDITPVETQFKQDKDMEIRKSTSISNTTMSKTFKHIDFPITHIVQLMYHANEL